MLVPRKVTTKNGWTHERFAPFLPVKSLRDSARCLTHRHLHQAINKLESIQRIEDDLRDAHDDSDTTHYSVGLGHDYLKESGPWWAMFRCYPGLREAFLVECLDTLVKLLGSKHHYQYANIEELRDTLNTHYPGHTSWSPALQRKLEDDVHWLGDARVHLCMRGVLYAMKPTWYRQFEEFSCKAKGVNYWVPQPYMDFLDKVFTAIHEPEKAPIAALRKDNGCLYIPAAAGFLSKELV